MTATNSINTNYADTRPTKGLMIGGITRDLPLEACIFDLIDNAIDAQLPLPDGNNLIELSISGLEFIIKDHGSGISLEDLRNNALRFGTIVQHTDGIGSFGIGLNRALFKLGKQVSITTESSNAAVSIEWNIDQYSHNDQEWNIPFNMIEKSNQTGTTIRITNLNNEVSEQFSNTEFISTLRNNISKTYGYLIHAGKCNIEVNQHEVQAHIPEYRADSTFSTKNRSYTKDDIHIKIKLGEHKDHFFKFEKHRSTTKTADYGWSVYCNGRAILLNDWTHKVGWEQTEHTQYYGMVGEIHFDGDPHKLPWNTAKNSVDLNNSIYSNALSTIKKYSASWRSHTNTAKNNPESLLPTNIDQEKTTNETQNASSTNETGLTQATNANPDAETHTTTQNQSNPTSNIEQTTNLPTNKEQKYNTQPHPNSWNYIFGPTPTSRGDFKIPKHEVKLLSVIKELQTLQISTYPCAIMFLMRSLIEESCKYYSRSNKNHPKLERKEPLAEQVKKCLEHMKTNGIITDNNQIQGITALCNTRSQSGILSIEYLQNSIHSSSSFLGSGVIIPFWLEIHPFIKACFHSSN